MNSELLGIKMSPNLRLRLVPKRATSLKQVLALKEPPQGGLAWHSLIEAGLATMSLCTVAKAIGVSEKFLANFLEVDLDGVKAGATLGARESDLLFAVARAYTRAATRIGTEQAGIWLVTPQRQLGDRAPLDTLRTRMGTEYVSGLINQMGQRSMSAKEGEEKRAVPQHAAAGGAPVA